MFRFGGQSGFTVPRNGGQSGFTVPRNRGHLEFSVPNKEYKGLEDRQTLRTCTSIVICKLKLKIDNLKFEAWKN